jgi:hypothetical protein
LKKGGLSRKAILASCWALADHTSKGEHIQILLEEESFPSIFQLLFRDVADEVKPCLEILAYASDNSECVKKYFQIDCLFIFEKLLDSESRTVRGKVCYILSNIVIVAPLAIMERKDLISKLVYLFEHDKKMSRKNLCFLFGSLWARSPL